MTYGLK